MSPDKSIIIHRERERIKTHSAVDKHEVSTAPNPYYLFPHFHLPYPHSSRSQKTHTHLLTSCYQVSRFRLKWKTKYPRNQGTRVYIWHDCIQSYRHWILQFTSLTVKINSVHFTDTWIWLYKKYISILLWRDAIDYMQYFNASLLKQLDHLVSIRDFFQKKF